MVITIGEFTHNLDSFTVSINNKSKDDIENPQEGWITRLNVDLDIDDDSNFNTITDAIVENLDSNEVVITNNSKEYNFSDYEFDGATRFVNKNSDRITLNFVKE